MKKFVRIGMLALFGSFASPAMAWDAWVKGEIILNEVAAGDNFGFRVWIKDSGPNCGDGSEGWSYINSSDSNYNVYVSSLMMARTTKIPVTLYTNRRGIYCWIEHLVF